ncbi:hypothetical protein ES705_31811 [subsurface metagenome]
MQKRTMKIKMTEYTDNIIKAFSYEVELDLKSPDFLEEFAIKRTEALEKYLKITEGVKEYFKKRKEVVSTEESLKQIEDGLEPNLYVDFSKVFKKKGDIYGSAVAAAVRSS